ncbi:MAG TPA: hypothetical protein VHC18_03300 [Amycolatopsis sp.]|jgi:hypothetical protein|nr:hypothetical protein [Amycolatopsis sp.]
MSTRARAARDLQALLAAETGVEVEVIWDRSATSRGWQWHLAWADGPSERAMRADVDRITALRASELLADDLAYLRAVQPRSVALSMVRNVRLGQPPLGRHAHIWELAQGFHADGAVFN